jgi:diadenosine tetraphosphatase ApaH/serine/threonine PP2A family protein phosphatase
MRCAILSDIHGNDDALAAVLEDIATISMRHPTPIDEIWCLGDLVGYGPEPSACIRLVRACSELCIAGNHDWVAAGKANSAEFTGAAAIVAAWTSRQLTGEERTYLAELPQIVATGDFTLAHGSPSNPIWEYLLTPAAARRNFPAFETRFCLVGHTHLPVIFLEPGNGRYPHGAQFGAQPAATALLTLDAPDWARLAHPGTAVAESSCTRIIPQPGPWTPPAGYRAIINPGSVGQPRDHDPRAAYMVYDSEQGFEFRRVPYEVSATQRKLRDHGLPERLGQRLAQGA